MTPFSAPITVGYGMGLYTYQQLSYQSLHNVHNIWQDLRAKNLEMTAEYNFPSGKTTSKKSPS